MIKVMIVEDETIERKALKILLDKYFKDEVEFVGEARDGEEAVKRALALKPDIILIDIEMPIMDGLEAALKIRGLLREVEFIIITAYDYFDYAKKAIAIPVNDYLLKPVSNEDFTKTLNKAIEKINKKKLKDEQEKKVLKQMKSIKPIIQKEIIRKIITGQAITVEEWDYKEMYNIKFNKFICVVLQCNENIRVEKEIFNEIKNKFKFASYDVIGEMYINKMIFFLVINDKKSSGDLFLKIH